MAFNFTNYAGLPTAQSPMNSLISRALETFTKGQQASYLPQQLQADITAKELGPYAALATNPMFLNNPQFQQHLTDILKRHGSFGGGTAEEGNVPTYASQAGNEAEEARKLAHSLTAAGKLKTGLSSKASIAESLLGELANPIIEAINKFTGGNVNSQLSKEANQFATKLAKLKNYALQTQSISPQDAENTFKQLPNETPDQTMERVSQTVPNLFQNKNEKLSDEEQNVMRKEQMVKDNEDITFALNLSQEIKERTGKDVPENLIFNYMQTHKGPVSIPKLLKAVGAK